MFLIRCPDGIIKVGMCIPKLVSIFIFLNMNDKGAQDIKVTKDNTVITTAKTGLSRKKIILGLLISSIILIVIVVGAVFMFSQLVIRPVPQAGGDNNAITSTPAPTSLNNNVSITPPYISPTEPILPTLIIDAPKTILENNTLTIQSQKLSRITNETSLPYDDLHDVDIANLLTFSYGNNVYYSQRVIYKSGQYDTPIQLQPFSVNGSTYSVDAIDPNSDNGIVNIKFRADGTVIWSKSLVFYAYNPVTSWFTAGGNVVLAYDNNAANWTPLYNDVIINAQSMNAKYSFSISYGAYPINNSAVYFGKKGNSNYIMVGDNMFKLPDNIAEVFDYHCCEPSAYGVSVKNDEMLFYSKNTNMYWYVNLVKFK